MNTAMSSTHISFDTPAPPNADSGLEAMSANAHTDTPRQIRTRKIRMKNISYAQLSDICSQNLGRWASRSAMLLSVGRYTRSRLLDVEYVTIREWRVPASAKSQPSCRRVTDCSPPNGFRLPLVGLVDDTPPPPLRARFSSPGSFASAPPLKSLEPRSLR